MRPKSIGDRNRLAAKIDWRPKSIGGLIRHAQLPLLCVCEQQTVDDAERGVERPEDKHLLVDEFVDAALPAEEKTGKDTEVGVGNVPRVRQRHRASLLTHESVDVHTHANTEVGVGNAPRVRQRVCDPG